MDARTKYSAQTCGRRTFLGLTVGLTVAGTEVLTRTRVVAQTTGPTTALDQSFAQAARPALAGLTALADQDAQNGGLAPMPIPWLDKNGSYNQMPGPGQEPSSIFHFKGRVARASGFTGTGTDNQGRRIPFGTATTDFSFMQGVYWAARAEHPGAFAHT